VMSSTAVTPSETHLRTCLARDDRVSGGVDTCGFPFGGNAAAVVPCYGYDA
jgi:hypothetical protein